MKFVFTVCCLMITFLAAGQYSGGIKGTVTDAAMNQEPVLFANVQIKDSGHETETNFHGNFEFNAIAPGEYTLVISYLGYETTEVPIIVNESNTTEVKTGLEVLLPSLGDFELEDDEVLKEGKIVAEQIVGEGSKE